MKNKLAKLITNEVNLRYFLGFDFEGYLVLHDKETIFFTDARYLEEASNILPFKVIGCEKKCLDEIFDYLSEEEINILIFEQSIGYDLFLKLKRKAKNKKIKIKSVSGLIEDKRQIKNKDELEKIRKSAEINNNIFKDVLKDIELGVTELDLKNKLEYYLRCYRASKSSFDLIVLFGKRTSMPHGISTNFKLELDMPILFDIGVQYEGYCSDMTRMVFFGNPNNEFIKDYNFIKDVQQKALENIKSGVKCKDIDLKVRDSFENENLDILHSTGHGVGLEIHEKPFLSINSKDTLKKDMVVTVEPGMYIKDKYGIRIEDLVIVKDDGYQLLSKIDKDLIFINGGKNIDFYK